MTVRYFPADTDLALADRIAAMAREDQDAILSDLDLEGLQNDFDFWGRESQLAAIRSKKPVVCLVGGRGAGKTRTISEKAHSYALENPGCKILLVGRTVADVRDVLVRGPAGILNVGQPVDRPRYIPGMRRLVWPNGSEALTISADNPDQLRGLQSNLSLADEIGAWPTKQSGSGLASAFDNLQIATRLGRNPQIFVATTPRRVPNVISLFERSDTSPDSIDIFRSSTYANRHLSKSYMEVLQGLYNGTSIASQELDGALLLDVDGAILKMQTINDARDPNPPDIRRLPLRAVGVDPSVSERPTDECGIVLVGATGQRELYKRHAWVYEDYSLLGSPQTWADEVIRVAREANAVVVVEVNLGGQIVEDALKAVDPTVPIVKVRATQGKRLRAEPVALAYEQRRVHHTQYFAALEDQMTSWDAALTTKSPDRLDALVWALSSLLVSTPAGWAGSVTASSSETRAARIPARIPTASTETILPSGLRIQPPSKHDKVERRTAKLAIRRIGRPRQR